MWMLDFISIMYANLYDDRTSSFSHCVKEAYDKTLANYHPFLVRQAFKLGMLAAPNREPFLHETKLTYEHMDHIRK